MNRKLVNLIALAVLCSSHSALAETVIIVNPASKLGSIAPEDVKRIYLGKTKSLPNGEATVPVDQAEGSASRDHFYGGVVGKNEVQLKAYWSQLIFSGKGTPPKVVGQDREVKEWVAKTAGGIGYVDKSAADSSVKIVGKVN